MQTALQPCCHPVPAPASCLQRLAPAGVHTVSYPARMPAEPALLPASPLAPQVSALRFLSQKGLCNCDFVVASTAVCTGSSLLASLVAEGPQQLAAEA